jgi:riboflavin biosynthesis pyrimidine reductase
MEALRTLIDQPLRSGPVLTPELRRLYDGELQFPDQPYVIGNFVSTLDGVISFLLPGQEGGGAISGNDERDRFIMGLLRASADAVLVGSGTLHATHPRHLWVAESVYRDAQELYAELRKALGKPPRPYNVIVSASGRVDISRRMFQTGEVAVRILTTSKGADRLRSAGAADLPSTEVWALDDSGGVLAPTTMLEALRARCGVRLLLHEGGPTVYAQFLAAGLVDELFVTIAPQLAGSSPAAPRPTMVWGVEFTPANAPQLQIVSAKQGGDHLYMRYARRVSRQ